MIVDDFASGKDALDYTTARKPTLKTLSRYKFVTCGGKRWRGEMSQSQNIWARRSNCPTYQDASKGIIRLPG